MNTGYYIPLELDGFGLNPYEFGFYCRVAKFSSADGKCKKSIDEIAQACGMDRKTAFKSAQSLESHRLISVIRSNGDVNEIVLTHPSVWISMSEDVENHEADSTGFVYLAHAIGTNRYKIGCSKDVDKRIKKLNQQAAFPIKVISAISSDQMISLENYFHQKFNRYRINGEWFELPEQAIAEFMQYGG